MTTERKSDLEAEYRVLAREHLRLVNELAANEQRKAEIQAELFECEPHGPLFKPETGNPQPVGAA